MFRRTDDNSVRSDIARLYSSHMVTAIESSEGGRLNEGLLKAITGHDKITSRELYEKEQERYLEAKIFFATNHEPVIKDSTHGMLRRLIKIPFAVQIPIDKRDDQIETRLIAEASGILNWLLDGLRAWNENGKKIKLSKVITDSTAAFRNTIDENREFFNDDVEITGAVSDTISKRDLFQYYEQWYNDKHGEYPSIKLQAFNKICQEHNITRDLRTKTGWIWIGVKHLTYDYKEKVRKEKEEREQEQEQKRKLTIDEIAHAVLNKKGVGEIDEIFNVHIQKGERVNPDEPHLVKYQNVFSIRGLGDKVHQGSPVHPVDVNTSNVHMQKGEPNNHKEPSSPGFVCSSSCGPAERSNCKSNPALCGRGIPS
jgi:phage/plasmid-associated DNA primase